MVMEGRRHRSRRDTTGGTPDARRDATTSARDRLAAARPTRRRAPHGAICVDASSWHTGASSSRDSTRRTSLTILSASGGGGDGASSTGDENAPPVLRSSAPSSFFGAAAAASAILSLYWRRAKIERGSVILSPCVVVVNSIAAATSRVRCAARGGRDAGSADRAAAARKEVSARRGSRTHREKNTRSEARRNARARRSFRGRARRARGTRAMTSGATRRDTGGAARGAPRAGVACATPRKATTTTTPSRELVVSEYQPFGSGRG